MITKQTIEACKDANRNNTVPKLIDDLSSLHM